MDKSDLVLVTGAGGLVGSAIVDLLKVQGFSRIVGIRRQDCDLSDLVATQLLFEKIRPDHILHAAALVFGIGGK